MAPQAAAPAISAKGQPGAPPRGFLSLPPFLLQVVGCQGEKSLLAGRSLHTSQETFLSALTFPPLLGAKVAALGMRKKRRGFATTLQAFTEAAPPVTSTFLQTQVLPHIEAHTQTLYSHFFLNSHKQQFVKHIDEASAIFRFLFYSLNPSAEFSL